MLARAVIKGVNVRTSADSGTNSNIIGQLAMDDRIELVAAYADAPKWWQVKWKGKDGYVARRLVTPIDCPPPVTLDAASAATVNSTIAKASADYDAITYGLGCKCARNAEGALKFGEGKDYDGKPCKGTRVDCSGWIAGLAQQIFAEVNKAAGRDVFAAGRANFLANVSDAQIVGISKRSAWRIWSGMDIDALTLRGGMVFGIDQKETRFEGNDRVFKIDHIVMGFEQDGAYHISQSSGGGKGVNTVTWAKWRKANDTLFKEYRVHCVDLMALGNWTGAEASGFEDPTGLHNDFITAPAG